jgi:peptide/nickel transport system ATP-binding protein
MNSELQTTQLQTSPILTVEDLHVHFQLDQGVVRAVDGISFQVNQGEIAGLIGESGCGKSVTAQAVMRIVPKPGKIVEGRILLYEGEDDTEGVDVAKLPRNSPELRNVRGGDISMIFQEPMTTFSPVHTIGNQIMEAIRGHGEPDKERARKIAVDMLDRVGIPRAEERVDAFSFQLSGGMRQRAMIAMALATRPRMLIADEPTTALDVTMQAQILALMKDLQAEFGMAILMITHDLGVIAESCHRVSVMYWGKIVESTTVKELFAKPLHPYTQALLESIPRMEKREGKLKMIRGSVPEPFAKVSGCPFHARCDHAIKGKCDFGAPPELKEVDPNHWAACWLYENE